MSAEVNLIGHQARSREGRGLSVRAGDSDKWIQIQKNTFMNWVNLQLQGTGHTVEDFEIDFDDGVKLCALVEALQHKKIGKVIKKPINQHQSLENVTLALKAVADDNVRLVNIGSEDVVNGNLKLILGLIWHLILRYQIGKTKFPPKKLMLAWLQAVIPECHITNFTSDWNDGVALSALIDYCQPGLFPEWRRLSRHNGLENCQNAMTVAKDKLNIPMVVHPEDLASPHLDDLSGMTYLSYYMMPESPGFYATRREVRAILQQGTFDNFTTDWNDGKLLCTLVKSVGGDIPGWPNISNNSVENLKKGLDAAQRLGIEPIFTAQEIADPQVEHLGVMAYAAYFTKMKPVKISNPRASFTGNFDSVHVNNEHATGKERKIKSASEVHKPVHIHSSAPVRKSSLVGNFDQLSFKKEHAAEKEIKVKHTSEVQKSAHIQSSAPVSKAALVGNFDQLTFKKQKTFQINLEDGSPDDIRATLNGPDSSPPVRLNWIGKVAHCSFVPVETGQHKLDIQCNSKSISGCPVNFRVTPDRSRITYHPPERCQVGVNTEFKIDATSAGQGNMRVEARSPSGRVNNLPVLYRQGIYNVNFTPSEVGMHEISVVYDGEHIHGSPFHLQVFDPTQVRIYGLDGGAVGRTLVFNADATRAGLGDIHAKVTYGGEVIPCHVIPDGSGQYKVDFTPVGAGQYKVNIFMNDIEVKGSPYILDVVDSSLVTLSGDGLSLVPVDRLATFTVHTKGAGSGSLNVDVTGPDNTHVEIKTRQVDKETFEVQYTPHKAGDYIISVKFNNEKIKGSPFVCKAFDTGNLIVSNMPNFSLPGNPVTFDIDASKAGSGNIEIRVNGGRVACSVENRGNHCFLGSFVPENNHTHTVDMSFNDKKVIGSPWKVHIVDPQKIKISTSKKNIVLVKQPTSFHIIHGNAPTEYIKVEIKDPKNLIVPHHISKDKSGDLHVTFTPKEIGDHLIHVKFAGVDVSGSPFITKTYNTKAITVTPLKDGYVGEHLSFQIDVQHAGEGELQIMVNNGNLPNDVDLISKGVYEISFVPEVPGLQQVDILFNNEHLPISPLKCHCKALEASVIELPHLIPVHKETAITVRSPAVTHVVASVIVLSPNGQMLPVKVRVQGSDSLVVEYTPKEIGTYIVNASLAGVPIKGSPFRVKSYDPSKVKVSKISKGIVGVPCKFIVDASSAGEGTMEISISSNGRNIPNQAREVGEGCYEVSFVGRQPLPHTTAITYNGHHVPGSPFQIDFLDASQMTATGDGLGLVPCHKQSDFLVHTPVANLKELNVDITGPDGRSVPARLRDLGDGTYKIEWTPATVGMHRVLVDYAGVPIGGSPYSVQVFDASLVKVSKIGQGFLGKPATFTLDANNAGDGNLEIHVMADGESVPNFVRQERDANFRVTFTPQKPVRHKINITFNGEPVPGNPFWCDILNTDSVMVTGDGLRMAPANTTTSFRVDPKGAGEFDLRAWVVSPSGLDVPVRITGSPHSAFRVDYTPVDVGTHKVFVEYGGLEVRGSPFDVEVFDPALVRVNSPGRAYISKPISFFIDSSLAGQGMIDAEVKCRGSIIPCQVRDTGNGRSEMIFTPRDVNTHLVNLNFNGLPLPGSPFHLDIIDSSNVSVSGEGLTSAKVYRQTWFNLDLRGMDSSDLDVSVIAPSGSRVPCGLSHKGHICRVEFTPMEAGPHMIDVAFAGSRIQGGPFTCEAYDPSRVRITDVDRTGRKEREIGFTIDTSAAGMGELEAVVTHHGHVIHTQRELLGEGRFRYTFLPGDTGHFEVNATFNDEIIPGCPLIINVEEDVPTFITISFRGAEPINVRGDRNKHFMLHMDGRKIDANLLNVNIEAPTGEKIPSHLVQQTDGDYRVEWTPKETGRHSVDVQFAGQQVKGSPFYIEVFDVTKVRVDKFYNGNVGEPAGFSVDTSRAGKCEQTVRVVSPSGRNVLVDVNESSSTMYNVTYVPTESGQHRIFLSYNSLEVPGSPFTQEIGEGALPPAYGDGLYRGEEDKTATFYIDARGMTGEPSVQVDGPNSIAKCSIDPQLDGKYEVTYVPVEVGMYDVQVKWNGKEISGSPFHPKVVCTRKVQVLRGWQHYMDQKERIHLVVNEEKRIPFDTLEAGPGKMTAEVKGPRGLIPVTVDESSVGRSTVVFTPREEGVHHIHLYWSDTPLVKSPFTGYATTGAADPSKVILTGRGLKEAIVREEAEFLIDASQAGEGEPEVQLVGVRAEVNVVVTRLGGGKFRCTYIPVIPGAYLLHITWNGRQLRGSPYKVNVIGVFFPNKVVVSGEGLKGGLLGRDLDVLIDTRKAGPGELTAYCMGPTKVAHCELEDHRDGTFRLVVRPQEFGRHILQVKYGNEHVQGSPFAFKISAQPDASKVRVSGPGVEHGILATFQSRFVVETRGAGAGQLTVRIRGPKGAFQVEMYRDSQKDRTILCRYDPTETGLYIISVRWSGVDVPGSPFHVHILDTQSELEQVLQETSLHNHTVNGNFHNSSFQSSRNSGFQWHDEM